MHAGTIAKLASISLMALSLTGAAPARPQSASAGKVSFAPPAGPRGGYTPQILGVATHFGSGRELGYTSGERAKAQMEDIGADSFRDGIAWASFRFADGKPPQMYRPPQRLVDFLPVSDVRPMLVLGASPETVKTTGMPFSDAQLGRFASYVKATVGMTRRYDPIFEVWNEYNMRVANEKPAPHMTGAGDPSDIRAAVHYAKLAKIGVQAVKQANPQAQVLVGAAGNDPDWKWTLATVQNGALDGADGLSVHLYNKCSPPDLRSATDMIERVKALQARLRKMRGGKDTPIYVSEFGWSTVRPNTRCGVSEERQGTNYAQYILQSSTLPWLKGSWIYELKDKGAQPRWIEENFGVFTFKDQPKPAACFIREAREIVTNARSVELKQPRPDVFVLRAVLPDRQVAAVWSNKITPSGRVQLSGQPRNVRTMCGNDASAAAPLSAAPLIAEYDLRQPFSVTVTG